MNISQCQVSYKERLERLEKFMLIWMANIEMENLVSSLISSLPDKVYKKSVANFACKFSNPALFRDITRGKDGDIYIPDTHLIEHIQELKKAARLEQVKFKTNIQILKDYFSETGLNVTFYKEYIKKMEKWAKSPKAMNLNMPIFKEYKANSSLFNSSESVDLKVDYRAILSVDNPLEENYDSVQVDQEIYDRLRQAWFNE